MHERIDNKLIAAVSVRHSSCCFTTCPFTSKPFWAFPQSNLALATLRWSSVSVSCAPHTKHFKHHTDLLQSDLHDNFWLHDHRVRLFHTVRHFRLRIRYRWFWTDLHPRSKLLLGILDWLPGFNRNGIRIVSPDPNYGCSSYVCSRRCSGHNCHLDL
jgi:hypothetical protein